MINTDMIKRMIQVYGKSYLTREAMKEVFDLRGIYSNELELCPSVVNFCQDENLLCRYIAPESINHVDKWEFVPHNNALHGELCRAPQFSSTIH